jgi:hypothetical protein
MISTVRTDYREKMAFPVAGKYFLPIQKMNILRLLWNIGGLSQGAHRQNKKKQVQKAFDNLHPG